VAQLPRSLPPQLGGDPVVNSILEHAWYISTKAAAESQLVLRASPSGFVASQPVTVAPPPKPITYADLTQFTRNVAIYALRDTGNPAGGAANDPFWSRLRAYYSAYYQGKFIDYFAHSVDAPKASLTIGDAEIASAVGVFVEALLDEVLQPTVWQDLDGKYYPGGVANKAGPPTYLSFSNKKPVPIAFAITGCGMNVPKASALGYLAQTFATAASAETSLSIKTAGGIEVGLGVLGKLNVGDNNTLTTVLQSVLPQLIKRLTVAFGAPILEAIDIEAMAGPDHAAFASGRTFTFAQAQIDRRITSIFIAK
jgi:hypothetical protein